MQIMEACRMSAIWPIDSCFAVPEVKITHDRMVDASVPDVMIPQRAMLRAMALRTEADRQKASLRLEAERRTTPKFPPFDVQIRNILTGRSHEASQ
jgi:hypothetical protein